VISWRYHLISIVAVFLSLGLGLLIGTGLLNQQLVDDLTQRTEVLKQQSEELRDQLALLRAFAEQSVTFAVEDRLLGRPVVLVTYEGADDQSLAQARAALEAAGAEVVTTLRLQPSLTDGSSADDQRLAAMLGVTPGGEVSQEALGALASRLVTGPPSSTDGDVLADLLTEGFVVARDPEVTSTEGVGGPGQSVIVVGGSTGTDPVDDVVVRFVQQLAEQGAVTAAAEGVLADDGFVPGVRALDPNGVIVTVDDVDLTPGEVALVVALERALELGQGGDYGTEDGVRLLPPAA
jgi:hypothetical protein